MIAIVPVLVHIGVYIFYAVDWRGWVASNKRMGRAANNPYSRRQTRLAFAIALLNLIAVATWTVVLAINMSGGGE